MSWRLAKSLVQLRNQINQKWPTRSRKSDGAVGDRAHAARASDHNPRGPNKTVHAIDVTHSPSTGFDVHALADRLRQSKDPRISYLISARRIASAKANWGWRVYRGSNPHQGHLHISCKSAPLGEQSQDWRI